jgi:hypothetical protein
MHEPVGRAPIAFLVVGNAFWQFWVVSSMQNDDGTGMARIGNRYSATIDMQERPNKTCGC